MHIRQSFNNHLHEQIMWGEWGERSWTFLSDCQAELKMNFAHCTFSLPFAAEAVFLRMRCSLHNRPVLVIDSF